MEILMRQPELGRAMGCKGRQWIMDHFEISRMTDEYVALYNKLLNKPINGNHIDTLT
jgi:hypothetical protein